MGDTREHWTTTLSRSVGLALAGFLLMTFLALFGSLASHAPGLPDVTATDIAPDAIRRTAQLLDPPGERWPDVRSVSSPAPSEGARGSGR
jgi:hypothetical protein